MTSRAAPPAAVRRAHAAWLLAVTAGVYETGLAIAHGFAESDLTVPELLVQLTVRGREPGSPPVRRGCRLP